MGPKQTPESEKELGHTACGSMDNQGTGSHPPGAGFRERGAVNSGQELRPGKLWAARQRPRLPGRV